MSDPIQTHHEGPAAMWSLGGRGYDNVSFAISDALGHAAQRLNAQPGDDVLDVATGTGWTARNVARSGARVTAVDIADGLLEAARELAAHVQPAIQFQRADAEALPFDDACFDRVISTFGVMFAANQPQAASELARVCKPGGRLILSTWAPGEAVAEFFAVISRFQHAPPPQGPTPMAWGDPDHVRSLLGEAFDLTFETGVSHNYFDSAEDAWGWYLGGFGPVKAVAEALSPERLEEFHQAINAYHATYAGPAGLHITRQYLISIGRRR